MARGERDLDPGEGVLLEFARGLRRLRQTAGNPTYRELSVRAHYSAAALSEAANGRKLPSLAVALAYVGACGGDRPEWEARWRDAEEQLASSDRPATECGTDEDAPYVGLAAFQLTDKDRFFGRENLVADLLRRIDDHRFVGVFGPSGSGKSSLLRAGLIPALAQPDVLVFTPGAHPIEECAVQLANRLSESPAVLRAEFAAAPANLHLRIRQAMADQPADLVLVVDQFEEVFTLADELERAWLISALAGAALAANSRVRVVLGVRADFYGHCGRYPDLVAALRDAQVLVGPMTANELRQAITQPAERIGCRVETALVSQLISDATGQPGMLPLVSHALRETWRRRRGTTLALAGYEAAGGVIHAVTRTAETVYTTATPTQRDIVRQVMLRLITVAEDTEATKRRIRRSELDDQDPNTGIVLETLAQARLIVLDNDRVDLAHEALIRRWPRLHTWLDDNRDDLRTYRQLTDAADTWETLDHDSGALYRGARLALAGQWASRNTDLLTSREQRFLDASVAAQHDEHRAARRRTRRLRQFVAAVTVLAVVTAATLVFAVRAQRETTRQRAHAIVQQASAAADKLFDANPTLAVQLWLAAYRLDPTTETRDSLLNIFSRQYPSRLAGHSDDVRAVAFSSDGQTVATASDDQTVKLWDITNPDRPEILATLTGLTNGARSVAFSPDGHTLAAGAADNSVRLWNLANLTHPVPVGMIMAHRNIISSVAFSPIDHLLATTSYDHTLRLWDVSNPAQPTELTTIDNGTNSFDAVAFSPDGQLLAAASSDQTTHLWDVDNHRGLIHTASLTGHTDSVTALTFGWDSHTLATGSRDKTARLWDITDPHSPTGLAVILLIGMVNAIAFTDYIQNTEHPELVYPTKLDIAEGQGILERYEIAEIRRPHPFPTLPGYHGQTIYALAASPDGTRLALVNSEHTAWLLPATAPSEPMPEPTVDNAIAFGCRHAYPTITPAEWNQYFPDFTYQPPCR